MILLCMAISKLAPGRKTRKNEKRKLGLVFLEIVVLWLRTDGPRIPRGGGKLA